MKNSPRYLVLLLIALVALCATMTCAIEHTNRVDDIIPNPSRITIATTPIPDHEKIKTVLGSATLNHYNMLKRANATEDDKIKPDNNNNNRYDYDDYVWSDDDVAFGLFLFGLFFILFPVLIIVAVQSKRRAKLQKEKEDNEAAARAALGHIGITITPAPDQTVAGAKRWVITIPDNFQQQQPQPYALPTTLAQQQQPQQHSINVAPQQPPQQYNPPQYVVAAPNPYQYQQQP